MFTGNEEMADDVTLTMAWLRDVGNTKELVVASDSRLTGGHQWDTAPKILCSASGDRVIAFAGGTYTKKWETREELRAAIVTWIERTYHRRRRKRSLGRMTPVECEAVFQVVDEEDVAA